jgi:hypothetical protein
MASLAQLDRQLKMRKGAVFLSINTDDTAEEVRQALEGVLPDGISFEVLLDPGARVVTEQYGTKLSPETWFIDPSGVIRARIDGARDYRQPLYANFAESLATTQGCEIEYRRGIPRGDNAWFCAR